MKKLWTLVKQTFTEWSEDKAPRLAAALAYYTIFSIPPLLVIAIAIAGLFLDRAAVQKSVIEQIGGLVGSQSQEAFTTMLDNASGISTNAGIIATVVGIVVLLMGASGVFGQLQDALNTMWEVKPKPGLGLFAMLRKRFFSFSMVLGVGFLLLVSLVVSTGLQALGQVLSNALPGSDFLYQILNFVISFAIITALFALMFKYVPDAKIAWGDVWLGAAVTALLFTIGKQLIGLYLGNSNVGTAFGAFGSLIIVLVWIYYSAQILFFGAEFTQVYANLFGSRVMPDKDAVRTTEGERANQGMDRKEEGRQADPQTERQARPVTQLGGVHPEAAAVAGAGAGQLAMRPETVVHVPYSDRTLTNRQVKETSPIVELLRSISPFLAALGVWLGGSLFIINRERRAIRKGKQLPGQDDAPHPKAQIKEARRHWWSRRK